MDGIKHDIKGWYVECPACGWTSTNYLYKPDARLILDIHKLTCWKHNDEQKTSD